MFWLVDKFKSVTSLNKLNKTHLPPILLIIQINYLLVLITEWYHNIDIDVGIEERSSITQVLCYKYWK